MSTPFTHEDGKISGTKTIAAILTAGITIRLLAPLFGGPDLDLTGAATLLGAGWAPYVGRRWTERRYDRGYYESYDDEYRSWGSYRP